MQAHKGAPLPLVSGARDRPGWSCWHCYRRRSQSSASLHNRGEQLAWDRDLRHLERNVSAVADNLRADLDQLLSKAGQRSIFDRFGHCERAKEVSEVVCQRMKLKANSVRVERATRKSRPFDRAFALFYRPP